MSDSWLHRQRWGASALALCLAATVLATTLVLLQHPASADMSAPARRPSHAASAGGAASQGWRTVFSETFGSELAPNWFVTDTNGAAGGIVRWGTSPFMYVSEPFSAWCAGRPGGFDSVYTDSMDSWLVSGPIQLGGPGHLPLGADVRFAWWLDADAGAGARPRSTSSSSVRRLSAPPESGDWLGWRILTDVTHLEGGQWSYVSGATAGWMQGRLRLDRFLPVTRGLTNTVHVAFRFVSDGDGAVGRGAFIDDVVVRQNHGYHTVLPLIGHQVPLTVSSTPTPSSLLRNGGFEDGWTDMAIGQMPNDWAWHWVDNEILPGSDAEAAAPEANVKSKDQFPPGERDLFVLDGWHCVKVFKSGAPMYAALSQDVTDLEIGRQYRFIVPVYVDVFSWEGEKVPPNDPWAAQVRLGVGPPDATWRDEESVSYGAWWNGDNTEHFYLAYNDYSLEFTAEASEMRVHVEVFAKWGLENNGFFLDDVRLLPLP